MKKKAVLLIVDDNKDVLTALEVLLEDDYDQLICIRNPNQIPAILQTKQPNVVLLDMNFSTQVNTGNEGLYWLKKIKEYDKNIQVVMFTAFGDVHVAVKAMKEGATDFVLKPWDNDKLMATLNAAVKLSQSQRESAKLKLQKEYLEEEITENRNPVLGQSQAFKKVIDTIEKVGPTDASVLITGENGSGKSILAHEIHSKSLRSKEAFVTVDLGALSESLFESELFGYKKGAFTDAKTDKPGRLITANGGTLFLDEIGNLSLNLQMKLLNVLQEKRVTPLGSNKSESLNIRFITATNQPLNQMIEKNQFREDLLYRINTISLEMPPLRERAEDIDMLTANFLEKFKKKYKRDELKVSKDFIQSLKAYNWPGNIRELAHAVEKCVILNQSGILEKSDFEQGKNSTNQSPSGSLEEIEKHAVLNAIKKHNGNMIRAARELDITRQTIYNKMKKYGL